MTECQKCPDHSGTIKSIEAINLRLDEREKQYALLGKIAELRVDSLTDNVALQFRSLRDALKVTEKNDERKFLELNGLRQEVITDRNQFLKVDTYTDKHDALKALLSALNVRVTVIETRSVVWTAALGIFFIIVQVALHFWTFRGG